MKLFGVDFPEIERPACPQCGAPMLLTHLKREAGREMRTFICFDCKREVNNVEAIDVTTETMSENPVTERE